jgi:hypothetical protein
MKMMVMLHFLVLEMPLKPLRQLMSLKVCRLGAQQSTRQARCQFPFLSLDPFPLPEVRRLFSCFIYAPCGAGY